MIWTKTDLGLDSEPTQRRDYGGRVCNFKQKESAGTAQKQISVFINSLRSLRSLSQASWCRLSPQPLARQKQWGAQVEGHLGRLREILSPCSELLQQDGNWRQPLMRLTGQLAWVLTGEQRPSLRLAEGGDQHRGGPLTFTSAL